MKKLFLLIIGVMSLGITSASAEGVFELRTYVTNDGKLDDLHARFNDHTIGLFEKHGMENIGYWEPVDIPNTLIYIIKHDSVNAAKQSWSDFVNDPAWKTVAEESGRNGPILSKAPDSVYMTSTQYSKIK
ncbi:MAG: NIPSNAP family protein [Emcibacteraceae bacterium]|nr:NIPSNAP family protein [Emcibacteraceae bacterium]